jgi:LuxR family maltose regulon positive regulatory protein
VLFERLSAAAPGTVTLVCAPAGSGKTVLLRSWAAERDDPLAWVTVDRGGRDAQRFWIELIEELAAAAGDDAVERVSAAPSFAGEVVVERLLDQLDELADPLVLVIDDLHELGSEDALAWLEMLLARVPALLRVVLGTREEPALGLHRLRLDGQLTELRAADLRFSLDETAAVLGAGGVALSDAAVASLHDRAEGWPAGVRLAAISLAAHPDPERFVAEFSGSERTVAGYLLTEVLERQPPDVRELLLRTSILERISGPLADALSGGAGAAAILQRLEDQNAFVSAIDARRSWFRCHQLFADLLSLELRQVAPETIPGLHRAAAAWYEQDGDVVEAVRHHQAAGDWAPAARLIVDNYLTLTMDGRSETLHALLGAFPDAPLGDGNLAAALAIDNIIHGLLDDAAAQLAVARRLAPEAPAERRRVFDVYLAVIEVELARRRGDLSTAQEATRGLEAVLGAAADANELPVAPDYWALVLMNLGLAELWGGSPDDARQHLEDALGRTRRIRRPFIEVGCLAHLAVHAVLTGQPLPVALGLSERAVAIAEEHGWTSQSVATGAFVMAGMALVWMGRFDDAERHLARAEESLRVAADPGTDLLLHHVRGMLRFGEGRLDEALADFERAEELERLLAGEHVVTADVRARGLQTRVRMGDTESAAHELAEPEGLILPFMLWPSRELLERHPRHRSAHATLISTIFDALAGRTAPGRGPATPLREELSDAELRVVRYLPSNMTASEIASELIVSANTVRTHMRHIYAKLDAHSRSEAVARARELGLVAPRALRR